MSLPEYLSVRKNREQFFLLLNISVFFILLEIMIFFTDYVSSIKASLAFLLAVIWGFFIYKFRKIIRDRADKQKILDELQKTYQDLERRAREISTLFEVSKTISSSLDLNAVLNQVLNSAMKILDARTGSLMLLDQDTDELTISVAYGLNEEAIKNTRIKKGQGISGRVASTGEPLLLTDLEKDPRFQNMKARKEIKSSLIVPLKMKEKVIGVVNINNRTTETLFTDSDLELLIALASQAAIAIENARLMASEAQKAIELRDALNKLQEQIELARDVQMQLIPHKLPEISGIDFGAKYLLSQKVGGDYYDFISLSQDKLGIVIGDVAGHEVSAALLMVMTRNVLRSVTAQKEAPDEVLYEANTTIFADTEPGMYVTLFYGVLDINTFSMKYCNAAHNHPIVIRGKARETLLLEEGGFALGMFEDFPYDAGEIGLQLGDIIIFYTDGLLEAYNAEKERFGKERLVNLLSENIHLNANELTDLVYNELEKFIGDEPLEDDMTFVIMKIV